MNSIKEEVALLPCPNPWCETSRPEVIERGDNFWKANLVLCVHCGMEGPCEKGATRAEAIAAWNTRAPSDLRAKAEGLAAEVASLRSRLVAEREENLWNAYHTGHEKDGKWGHSFMSDGEWLAGECGYDPRKGYYEAAEIKARIPVAAKKALTEWDQSQ